MQSFKNGIISAPKTITIDNSALLLTRESKYKILQKTSLETYLKWLDECGFNSIKYFSDFKEYDELCERIIFVCRKG